MLKLLGALLLIGAGTGFGLLKARRLADRPAQIRRLVRMLNQLETEIAFGYTPLPEALARIGRHGADPLAALFREAAGRLKEGERAVADAWGQAVENAWGRTAMKRGEKEVLLTLGHTLGATDRDDQARHLRLAVKQLETLEPDAAEEQRKYEKMWKSLGILGGALIAVLLY